MTRRGISATVLTLLCLTTIKIEGISGDDARSFTRTDAELALAHIESLKSDYNEILKIAKAAPQYLPGQEFTLLLWANPNAWLQDPIETAMRKINVYGMLLENIRARTMGGGAPWSENQLLDAAYVRGK